MSGARALSRLLVALIESLGRQDKLGRRHAPGWPHGTTRSAFGPTPLGAEIERLMTAPPLAAAPHAAVRDAVTGLPLVDPAEIRSQPIPSATVRPQAPLQRGPAPKMPPIAKAPADAPAGIRTRPPLGPAPADPLAAMPAWQRPFIAAPGVRYMRTPDHLLRRAREVTAPIAPIEPEPFDALDLPISPLDLPVDLGATGVDDSVDAPDMNTEYADEVELLNIEDQAAFGARPASPRRLSMMSGFAVAPPLPANDHWRVR